MRIPSTRRPLILLLVLGLFLAPALVQLSSPAHAQGGPTIEQQIKLLELKVKAGDLELKINQTIDKAESSEVRTALKKMRRDVKKIKTKIEALLP